MPRNPTFQDRVRVTAPDHLRYLLNDYMAYVADRVNHGLEGLRQATAQDERRVWTHARKFRVEPTYAPEDYADRLAFLRGSLLAVCREPGYFVDMLCYEILRLWRCGERDRRDPGAPARFVSRVVQWESPGILRFYFRGNSHHFPHEIPSAWQPPARPTGWIHRADDAFHLEFARGRNGSVCAESERKHQPPRKAPNQTPWTGRHHAWLASLQDRDRERVCELYSDVVGTWTRLEHIGPRRRSQHARDIRREMHRLATELQRVATILHCPEGLDLSPFLPSQAKSE